MEQTFTPNQLIQFLYGETDLLETLEIAEEIKQDPLLLEDFEELEEAYNELPNVRFSPSPQTVSRILQYSRQATLETQP